MRSEIFHLNNHCQELHVGDGQAPEVFEGEACGVADHRDPSHLGLDLPGHHHGQHEAVGEYLMERHPTVRIPIGELGIKRSRFKFN